MKFTISTLWAATGRTVLPTKFTKNVKGDRSRWLWQGFPRQLTMVSFVGKILMLLGMTGVFLIDMFLHKDIDYIDRSFGFYSAIEAAQNSIRTALVEARCTLPNGVGVIKFMGRSAGFLAAFAALGSGDVDAVLLPEVPVVLRGEDGILPHIFKRVKEKQHAVVVVAEGAGSELLGQTGEKEAGSGNQLLPPIAEYIRDQIKAYFAEQNEEVRMKYVDPSYSVRSVPANAIDSLYCYQLAHNAVHGCMSGLTGFSCGMVNNRTVYIPIPQLVATSPRSMDPNGPIYDRILSMTGQPVPALNGNKEKGRHKAMNSSTSFPRLPEPTVH
jgi:6-phosphofructokinase 1